MFTGIIEEKGFVKAINHMSHQAIQLTLGAQKVLTDVKVGDSIAVNGICLTVTSYSEQTFNVDVMPETMQATSLQDIRVGKIVNLERSLRADDRLGGHFVTGHVDHTGEIICKERVENAIYYDIKMPKESMNLYIEKGSVAIDGVSLTIFQLDDECQTITISLIPHTVSETILGEKTVGSIVNVECDVLAKLIQRQMQGRE